jgi:hypothetical protein
MAVYRASPLFMYGLMLLLALCVIRWPWLKSFPSGHKPDSGIVVSFIWVGALQSATLLIVSVAVVVLA